MKTNLNDGRDLRRGSITGTQPGESTSQIERDLADAETLRIKNRMRAARGLAPRQNRERFKPPPGERVSATGIVRRSGNHNPPPQPKVSAPEPAPITEWDNPYLKRKMPKWERDHLRAVRKAREDAASDPKNPVDRAAIIKRDGRVCWICKKPVEHRDLELDHVVPLTRGGKHTPENLRVSCKSCNAWHGDRLVQPL